MQDSVEQPSMFNGYSNSKKKITYKERALQKKQERQAMKDEIKAYENG